MCVDKQGYGILYLYIRDIEYKVNSTMLTGKTLISPAVYIVANVMTRFKNGWQGSGFLKVLRDFFGMVPGKPLRHNERNNYLLCIFQDLKTAT